MTFSRVSRVRETKTGNGDGVTSCSSTSSVELRRLSLTDITVGASLTVPRPTACRSIQLVMVCVAPVAGAEEKWLTLGDHAFYPRAGRMQPLDKIVKNAIATDGLLVLKQHVGLMLRDGEVRGMEIYSPALTHFCYIRTYVDLLDQFGLPDAVVIRRPHGEALDHTLLYRRSDKQLVWDCRQTALSLVRLGQADAHAPRARKRRPARVRRAPRDSAPTMPLPLGDWAPQAG